MLRFNFVVLEISRVFLSERLQRKEMRGSGKGGGGGGGRHKAKKNYYNVTGSFPAPVWARHETLLWE